MSISTIVDTRIRLKASKQLLDFLNKHKNDFMQMPENIAKLLKQQGCSLPSKVEMLSNTATSKSNELDIKLLNKILEEHKDSDKALNNSSKQKKTDSSKQHEQQQSKCNDAETFLLLADLKWLSNQLLKLRKEQGSDLYLHNLLDSCDLHLPENEIIERNPELEARCQKLREEQQNRDYLKMTKNVDSVLKNYPEDTIAYQIKSINRQIIAVLQFVFSVAAGFAFGFLGVELIIGNLDFGFRLLLGIMCSLIIALAEIYFLAKKLNEFDDAVANPAGPNQTPTRKLHAD